MLPRQVFMPVFHLGECRSSSLFWWEGSILFRAFNKGNPAWSPRGLYKGLATRTKRVAAKSIAAIPAESIPFIGVAVLIADTGYEFYAACETVQDLDQLYVELGMDDEVEGDGSLH
jgi:hypothetical protein